MPIKAKIYRCKTEQEAIACMEQESGRKMYPCVYPSRIGHDYYISKDGMMYVSRWYHVTKIYMVYKINARENAFLRNHDMSYTMASPNDIEDVLVQKLVYCTFALGYWDANVSILFKDKNHQNCHIDNLYAKDTDGLTEQHADMMTRFLPDYMQHFASIQKFIQYLYRLTKEEAQDCTEDAFLKIIGRTHDINLDHFVGYWINMARKMSLGYVQRRVVNIDLEDVTPTYGLYDTPISIDLLRILTDNSQRDIMELKADGYTDTQIGDMIGMTKTQVWKRSKKARKTLRDYLKTDKEIMKIYA